MASSVSDAGSYGFTEAGRAASTGGEAAGGGIPGGVGGGEGHRPHVVFYVGVPDVAALSRAEGLCGRRAMGPERSPGTELVVAHFTDPEGNSLAPPAPAEA